MTDLTQSEDAREADDRAAASDLGPTPDTPAHGLTGSDSGSDTRAGSLRGGSASGSDDDPDQDEINAALAREGMASAEPQSSVSAAPDEARADPGESGRTDPDAAATG